MNFFETLREKRGPLPTWAWALLFTGLLAVYLIHRRQKAGSSANGAASQAAANQANSNLGSAAELANMFEVAGLMPYSGGNVYVNEAQGVPTPMKPSGPPNPGRGPVYINVGPGTALSTVVAQAKAYDKNFTWQDLWTLNPQISKVLHYNGTPGNYTFTQGYKVNIDAKGNLQPGISGPGYYIKNKQGQYIWRAGIPPKGSGTYFDWVNGKPVQHTA